MQALAPQAKVRNVMIGCGTNSFSKTDMIRPLRRKLKGRIKARLLCQFRPKRKSLIVAIRSSLSISDIHLVFVLTVHFSSPAMSVANNEAQSSSDTPPFRQGALDAAEIRNECPQFRVLVIGKANAGKTTILRKVCNAKPDAKPVIYDAEGKRVKQDSAKVGLENLSLGAN